MSFYMFEDVHGETLVKIADVPSNFLPSFYKPGEVLVTPTGAWASCTPTKAGGAGGGMGWRVVMSPEVPEILGKSNGCV